MARALAESPGIASRFRGAGCRPSKTRRPWRASAGTSTRSRSGDIYVAQKPYWFLFDKGPVAVMHGSPWRYDTHVPVVFAGPGIPARRVHRRVRTVDVAPTLAAILGMSPPSSAAGSALEEVLR